MQEFSKKGSHNPVVFHLDLEETQMMSFDVFLARFEQMLLLTIIENRVKLLGEEKGANI